MNLANLGVIRKSGVVSIPQFAPTDLTGIQLWLDASQESYSDAQNVTTASDYSGNSQDFSGTGVSYSTNEINGLPAFSIPPPGLLSNANRSNWTFLHSVASSVFVVSKVDLVGDDYTFFLNSSNAGSTATGYSLYAANRANNSAVNALRLTVSRSVSGSNALIANGTSNVVINNQYAIYKSFTDMSLTSGNNELQVNDGTIFSTNRSAPPSTGVSTFDLMIGYTGSVSYFKAPDLVAEVIVYNRVLTTSEKTSVVDYLNTKYAL